MGRRDRFKRREGSTVDEWLSGIEGFHVGAYHGENEAIVCDYCSGVINPNTQSTQYAADRVLNSRPTTGMAEDGSPVQASRHGADTPMQLLRIYCEDCNRRRVAYPCRGFHEIILSGEITPDKRFAEGMEILDLSTKDEGVPFDPVELWETVVGVPFDLYIEMADNMAVGPEDIVDGITVYGVDIRDVVDEDGTIEVTPEIRQQFQEGLDEQVDRLRDGGDWSPP